MHRVRAHHGHRMLGIENPLDQPGSLFRITSHTARRLPRDRPTACQMLLESTPRWRYPSPAWRVCGGPQHRQIDSTHNQTLQKIMSQGRKPEGFMVPRYAHDARVG
jgi:hypothetical protein